MSLNGNKKTREIDALGMEARKLQEAIEILNRAGLEHHFGTFTLQKERDAKLARIDKLWTSLHARA